MTVTDKLYEQLPKTLEAHIGTWEGEIKTFGLFIEAHKCYYVECEIVEDIAQVEFYRKKDGRVLFLERGETLADLLNKMQHTLTSYDIRIDHDEFILNGREITFYKGYDRKPLTEEEAEEYLTQRGITNKQND